MERREFLAGAGVMAASMLAAKAVADKGAPKGDPNEKGALLWQDITVDGFDAAVKRTQGVVLVPFGCLEKHGHHMPLGTDSLVAHEICRRAAERETAVIFPMSPFGMVEEVKHMRGTMSISNRTMFALFDEMCDEFARNGLTKIVFVNDHGGNGSFLSMFLKSRLEKRHPYQCYSWFKRLTPEQEPEFLRRLGRTTMPDMGHADIIESSEILAMTPEKMHMERVNPEESRNLNRLGFYDPYRVDTPIAWYGARPTHFAGDPTGANPELGEWLLESFADTLSKVIRLVKDDKLTGRLQDEYYDALENPHV